MFTSHTVKSRSGDIPEKWEPSRQSISVPVSPIALLATRTGRSSSLASGRPSCSPPFGRLRASLVNQHQVYEQSHPASNVKTRKKLFHVQSNAVEHDAKSQGNLLVRASMTDQPRDLGLPSSEAGLYDKESPARLAEQVGQHFAIV